MNQYDFFTILPFYAYKYMNFIKYPQIIRRLLILSTIYLGLGNTCQANFIAGATLFMNQLKPGSFRFQVGVRVYVDMRNKSQVERELLELTSHEIRVFRQRDHKAVAYFFLPFNTFKEVTYLKQGCSKKLTLGTRIYTYATEVELNPTDFEEPEGYYLGWTRCCRNQPISNLNDPLGTGMQLVAEIPRLSIDGKAVSFSLPEFREFSDEPICRNNLFSYSFLANDLNGDQLKYRLVDPLAGASTRNAPNALVMPGPYKFLPYAPGFSLNQLTPNPRPVGIDVATGKLTLQTSSLGTYSFVVLCEKYRNGRKIGSVRHEFQFPVTDCEPPTAPLITAKDGTISQATLCVGDSLLLSSAFSSDWTYQWEKDDQPISSATKNYWNVSQPGSYQLRRGSAKTCTQDTTSNSVLVTYTNPPNSPRITTADTSFCSGDSLRLTTNSSSSYTIGWYRQDILLSTATSLWIKEPGQYTLQARLKDGCRIQDDSIQVTRWPSPQLPNPTTAEICPQDTLQIEVPGTIGQSFEWFQQDKLLGRTASILVNSTGQYHVRVTDERGCYTNSKPYVVRLKNDCPISALFIPTAFTPNSDGVNDVWEIKNSLQASQLEISVFNRWGDRVFFSNQSFWDGNYNSQPVATGIYAYLVRDLSNGIVYRGTVTVLR